MKNYASFGRRFVAALIDGLIVGAINLVVTRIFGIGSVPAGTYSAYAYMNAYSSGFRLFFFLALLIGWGYYVYFIGSRGQTLGKMAMGIKVVNANGGKGHPDYLHAFLREVIGRFISSLVFLLGYLWMLWDPKKQTWHDKIAGTVVVKV